MNVLGKVRKEAREAIVLGEERHEERVAATAPEVPDAQKNLLAVAAREGARDANQPLKILNYLEAHGGYPIRALDPLGGRGGYRSTRPWEHPGARGGYPTPALELWVAVDEYLAPV